MGLSDRDQRVACFHGTAPFRFDIITPKELIRLKYFRTWILHFVDVDLPIGDLASDIKNDPEFPRANKKEVILEYLRSRQAIPEAIQTFEDAWDYYLKSR
jgi:uncharacterized protein YozE (UPF0346 family)